MASDPEPIRPREPAPISLAELEVATTFLTIEIVAALAPNPIEARERLEEIASRLLDLAKTAEDAGRRRILEAMAHGLITSEHN